MDPCDPPKDANTALQQQQQQQQPLLSVDSQSPKSRMQATGQQPCCGCHCHCPDVIFAFLFLAQLGAIIFIGVWGLENEESMEGSSHPEDAIQFRHWPDYLNFFTLGSFLGLAIALLLMVLARFTPRFILALSVFGSLSLVLGGGVVLLLLKQFYAGAAVCAVALLGVFIMTFWASHALRFSSEFLVMGTKALFSNTGIFLVALLVLIIQLAFTALLLFALFSLMARDCSEQRGCSYRPLNWLMLLPYFWAMEVLCSILHMSVAGAVGSFYFFQRCGTTSSNTQGESIPSLRAFGRALSGSFGSICFGSLLVGCFSFLHSLAVFARTKRTCAGGCFRCLCCVCQVMMSCIETLLGLFNRYAFTHMALYGTSYMDSSRNAYRLIQQRGLTPIANDAMTFFVPILGGLFTGGFTAAGSYAYMKWDGSFNQKEILVVAVSGGLLTFQVALLVLSMLSSAVTSFFVSFAEQPSILEDTQPVLFQELYERIGDQGNGDDLTSDLTRNKTNKRSSPSP